MKSAPDLSLREELRSLWRQSRDEDAHNRRSYLEWAKLAPEPKSGTLNFRDFPFQPELLSQEVGLATNVVIKKATQAGISMLTWRWAGWRADVFGDTVLYVFPTEKHVSKFGDERIEPSIQASPYLTRRIPSEYVRQKQLKRIGNGWLHLQGSNSRAGSQSTAADALVFDEYDELDQGNVEQIERRISGAAAAGRQPRVRRIGIPTIPGFGMDAAYKRSDRREWHVHCSCGTEQTVEWWSNVVWTMPGSDEIMRPGKDYFDDPGVVGEVWRVCQDCGARLDVSHGEWRATRASDTVGYFVPRLIVPRTDLAAIVKASRKTLPHEVQAFYNNDLGEAWQAADAGVTEEEVLRACSFGGATSPTLLPQLDPVVMGLDVASTRNLHAVVQMVRRDGSRDALAMKECADFADAAELMRRYSVRLCVVDHLPETRSARALQADFPGRVLLAAYAEHPSSEPFQLNLDKQMVTANRTILLDAMLEGVRHVRVRPLRQPPRHYVEHLTAFHRMSELDDKTGQVTHRYISTGPDDWGHAEAYALLATESLLFEEIARGLFDAEFTPASDEALGIDRERVRLDLANAETYEGGMVGYERDFAD